MRVKDYEMPVLNLFSYRKRVANGCTPDVFVYDKLPEALRVQIALIWRDAIGPFFVGTTYGFPPPNNNMGWETIHDAVAREHGVFALGDQISIADRCVTYLLETRSVDEALDLIEASFLYVDKVVRGFGPPDREGFGIKVTAGDAVDELNERFRRASVGYQFEDGRLFRVDSELIHAEVVRPALRYLHQRGFEGPRDEFLQAHGHYRAGQTKDAITDANNAFESTLKAICDQRRWGYPPGARASDLLKLVRANGLLPDYLDNSFDQLAATLKSGLPKVRGEEGAHGAAHQAPEPGFRSVSSPTTPQLSVYDKMGARRVFRDDPTMSLVGYARVSTAEGRQVLDRPLDALKRPAVSGSSRITPRARQLSARTSLPASTRSSLRRQFTTRAPNFATETSGEQRRGVDVSITDSSCDAAKALIDQMFHQSYRHGCVRIHGAED